MDGWGRNFMSSERALNSVLDGISHSAYPGGSGSVQKNP